MNMKNFNIFCLLLLSLPAFLFGKNKPEKKTKNKSDDTKVLPVASKIQQLTAKDLVESRVIKEKKKEKNLEKSKIQAELLEEGEYQDYSQILGESKQQIAKDASKLIDNSEKKKNKF